MRVFDPKDVNLVVGGRIITGFAEGTFINAERMEDMFTEYVGAKGEVAFAENANETGEITITLERTSPSVPYLNSLALRRKESAIVPTQIIDLNTNGVSAVGQRTRVRKPASYQAGKEINEVEFVIFAEKLDYK